MCLRASSVEPCPDGRECPRSHHAHSSSPSFDALIVPSLGTRHLSWSNSTITSFPDKHYIAQCPINPHLRVMCPRASSIGSGSTERECPTIASWPFLLTFIHFSHRPLARSFCDTLVHPSFPFIHRLISLLFI